MVWYLADNPDMARTRCLEAGRTTSVCMNIASTLLAASTEATVFSCRCFAQRCHRRSRQPCFSLGFSSFQNTSTGGEVYFSRRRQTLSTSPNQIAAWIHGVTINYVSLVHRKLVTMYQSTVLCCTHGHVTIWMRARNNYYFVYWACAL